MHTIQSAAEKTGLTPDVIRIWERRYQAVSPHRTASNQRLYSDAEIDRLTLLRQLTEQGRRISAIANLNDDQLQELAGQQPSSQVPVASKNSIRDLTDAAVEATLQLDSQALQTILEQALVQLGSVGFMMRFASPLLETIGELWRSGAVRTCQEHFASAHLRSFLGRHMLDANTDPDGPRIVVATLPGQAHELGATMAAVVAAQGGWNVIYLGPSVPIEEIAFSADCKDARAVAISLSYPLDDPRVPYLLQDLRAKLPKGCRLLVGGVAAAGHQTLINQLGAWRAEDLTRLAAHLDSLR